VEESGHGLILGTSPFIPWRDSGSGQEILDNLSPGRKLNLQPLEYETGTPLDRIVQLKIHYKKQRPTAPVRL